MELVRLELKNFLSYREGVLDFNGLRMAALVGPNGAGKSSLLDAITWALWGKTSRLDRDQDLLVHRGEKEARVSLTFRLGEALYQVTAPAAGGKAAPWTSRCWRPAVAPSPAPASGRPSGLSPRPSGSTSKPS
jgi:exonuclease SbcC